MEEVVSTMGEMNPTPAPRAKSGARILRRGMWNLAEVPVVLSKFTPFIEESSPEISSVPLWITIKHVPRDIFSWKGLSFLASAVGAPVKLHLEPTQCLNLENANFFVKSDLTKELPTSMKLSHKGSESTVEFLYPWLPARCLICRK